MKIFFGYLFLFVCTGLTFVQISIFPSVDLAERHRLFIIIGLTLGSLLGARLALSIDENHPARKIASGIGAILSILLIIIIAYHAILETSTISPYEFAVLIFYALMFGLYAFSGFGIRFD